MKVKLLNVPKDEKILAIGDEAYSDMVPIRNELKPTEILYRVRTPNGTKLFKAEDIKVIGSDDDEIQELIDNGIVGSDTLRNLNIVNLIQESPFLKIKGQKFPIRVVMFSADGIPTGWICSRENLTTMPIEDMYLKNIESSIFVKKFLDEEKEPYILIQTGKKDFKSVSMFNMVLTHTRGNNYGTVSKELLEEFLVSAEFEPSIIITSRITAINSSAFSGCNSLTPIP